MDCNRSWEASFDEVLILIFKENNYNPDIARQKAQERLDRFNFSHEEVHHKILTDRLADYLEKNCGWLGNKIRPDGQKKHSSTDTANAKYLLWRYLRNEGYQLPGGKVLTKEMFRRLFKTSKATMANKDKDPKSPQYNKDYYDYGKRIIENILYNYK